MNKIATTFYALTIFILFGCKTENRNIVGEQAVNTDEVAQEVISPIPEYVLLCIDKLNKNGFGIELENIELIRYNNTEEYSFSVPNGCGESTSDYFYFSGKDDDTWEYETAACGSGGGSSNGVIMFLADRVVKLEAYTSCAGAADCYEYVSLGINGKEVFSKRYSLSD
jgi:hypothetical protein